MEDTSKPFFGGQEFRAGGAALDGYGGGEKR